MAGAFQASAFQNTAFQVGEVVPPEPSDTWLHRIGGSLVAIGEVSGTIITYGGSMNEPFYRGEAHTLLVTVEVDDAPVNLTSGAYALSALEYTLKPSLVDGEPVSITKTLGAGVTRLAQSGATLGQATIDIDTDDTRDLPPGDYWEMVSAVFASTAGEHKYPIKPRRRLVRGVVKVPA